MRKPRDYFDIAYSIFDEAGRQSLMYLTAEDEALNGRYIEVNGKQCLNFGSCSYLGLELDNRLKQGAIDAVMRYGTQFSSSRAYMSIPLYSELEELFQRIFGMPVLIAPTTSLAHIATLPILVQEEDVVILDQQAHHSIQTAANLVRVQGTRIELIRHNRMEQLETLLKECRGKHPRVWYMIDGIYSMFGDFPPIEALNDLMKRYEQLYLYVDDAHAMSWYGENGKGFILEQIHAKERMVVATSLAKAFGVVGGLLIIPDPVLRRKVNTVGGPMVFSGPIQPANLGAAIASARIHLTDEIYQRQAQILERIQLCNRLIHEAGLPLVTQNETPIRFIGVGSPKVTHAVVARLMEEGFYTNISTFPMVPMKRAGIRFTLTLHHTPEDIRCLIDAIARHLPKVLTEEGSSIEEVMRAFALAPAMPILPPPDEQSLALVSKVSMHPTLKLEHETTIQAIDRNEWNRLLGNNGTFTWEGMVFLEAAYQDNPEPENNWKFHYYIVRDESGTPVLATFFTEGLWKDDMVAPERVSRQIEQRRGKAPYFLTSKVFAMGAMMTEGNHLYLDRGGNWKESMVLLLRAAEEERVRCGATAITLRDLRGDDPEFDAFMIEHGFAKFMMPESFILELDWKSDEEFLSKLSPKSRLYQRREVLPWESAFEVEVIGTNGRTPSKAEFEHYYQLYKNVKARAFLLNTFDLPKDIFEKILAHPSWELMALYLRPEFGGARGALPIGISAGFVGPEQFVPYVIGLDYQYVKSHRSYRQFYLQAIRRAMHFGSRKMLLGIGAPIEKRRFGAKAEPRCIYTLSSDQYQHDVLAQMMADSAQPGFQT